jgi:hypothetical protein
MILVDILKSLLSVLMSRKKEVVQKKVEVCIPEHARAKAGIISPPEPVKPSPPQELTEEFGVGYTHDFSTDAVVDSASSDPAGFIELKSEEIGLKEPSVQNDIQNNSSAQKVSSTSIEFAKEINSELTSSNKFKNSNNSNNLNESNDSNSNIDSTNFSSKKPSTVFTDNIFVAIEVYEGGDCILITGYVEKGKLKVGMKAPRPKGELTITEVRLKNEQVSVLEQGYSGTIVVKASLPGIIKYEERLFFQ